MASSARADGSMAVAEGADNMLLLTPKRRPTSGSDKTTPGKSSPPPTLRRAKPMSPSPVASKMSPSPSKRTMKNAMKVSPLSKTTNPKTKDSSPKGKKSSGNALQSPKKAQQGSGSALPMKTMTKKLPMKSIKYAMKSLPSSSSSSKAPSTATGKVKKTVLKTKAKPASKKPFRVGIHKKPSSGVTITLGEPGMVMVERGQDPRLAEGKTKFWSQHHPDELREFLQHCHSEWLVVWDWNTSFVIEGTAVVADPWPVWAHNELEGAGWKLMDRKGCRERWEKDQ